MKCKGNPEHKGTRLVQSGKGRYKELCAVCFIWIQFVYQDELKKARE